MMGLEIERKFLVDKKLFKPLSKGKNIRQMYLNRGAGYSIRIRIMGSEAFITIKKTISDMIRNEFEYEIPLKDAEEMFDIFNEMPVIDKIRYQFLFEGHEWVVDEFYGKNKGLLLAEIELKSKETKFTKPTWLLKEVTNDSCYYNSNLAVNPLPE